MTLNTWGCKVPEIFEYIKQKADDIDVFCFQEILSNGIGVTERGEPKDSLQKIDALLPSHTGYFLSYGDGGYYSQNNSSLDFQYGLAVYARKSLSQGTAEGVPLYTLEGKWSEYTKKVAAGLLLSIPVDSFLVVNIHGLWEEGSYKKDTDIRFEQLRIIEEYLGQFDEPKILCGDFNVLPDTKFLKTLDGSYDNLITKYGISSTRSTLYEKELRFADYMMVDKTIPIINCSVDDIAVSDHLPLIAEIGRV